MPSECPPPPLPLPCCRSDNSVELWDVSCALSQRGAPVCQARLPPAGGASVEALAWSGGRLFSTGLHGHVLEHGGDGLEATASTSVTGGAAWCLAAERAGRRLAAGTEDGQVVIHSVTPQGLVFDRRLAKQVSHPPPVHGTSCNCQPMLPARPIATASSRLFFCVGQNAFAFLKPTQDNSLHSKRKIQMSVICSAQVSVNEIAYFCFYFSNLCFIKVVVSYRAAESTKFQRLRLRLRLGKIDSDSNSDSISDSISDSDPPQSLISHIEGNALIKTVISSLQCL